MGEFLNTFPPQLRERLISYAQDPNNFKSVITLAELDKLPFNITDEQWQEARTLIGNAEVNSLDVENDYAETEKTKEVEEVEHFFINTWPIPEK